MTDPIDVHKVFAEYFEGCEALAYALSRKLAEGHMCLDIKKYKEELSDLIKEKKEDETSAEDNGKFIVTLEKFEKQLSNEKFVTLDANTLKPFVIHNDKAYLQRYFLYENQIIDNIKRLGDNFHIITGGPGSGKTYSVSEILRQKLKENPDLKIAMAAPTGKAAARMNESIRKYLVKEGERIEEEIKSLLAGLKAQTIHRLLGTKPDSIFFRFNKDNKLPYDVLIIDECSMVDGAIMAKLLSAIGENTILYLLGDKDQLASVEAGSVFGDLCRARESELLKGKVNVIEGSKRFTEDAGIWKLSKEVINGTFSDISSYKGNNQIEIDILNSEKPKENLFKEKVLKSDLFRRYASLYEEYINCERIEDALKSINKIRFLCVTRENDYSVAETNRAIEKYLKYKINNKEKFDPKDGFYHNQPVIITKNDYRLNIFNGDVGIIRRKKTEDKDVLMAYFETTEGEVKEFPAGYLNFYETVFAMTIHKSQGSEFDNVYIILPEKQGEKLLTRELLYTAITRAMEKVVVQSTESILADCVKKVVTRASGLEGQINKYKS